MVVAALCSGLWACADDATREAAVASKALDGILESATTGDDGSTEVRVKLVTGEELAFHLNKRARLVTYVPGDKAFSRHLERRRLGDYVGHHVIGSAVQSTGAWRSQRLEIELTAAEHDAMLLEARRAEEERQAAIANAEAERQQKIAAWRALKKKPPLPPEAERNRVLAEDAVNEKRFEDAVRYYEAGLKIEPLWPEAHFNAAAICGELRNYAAAVSHMHAYLELLPDAPDAQAAREKIIIWEEKAKSASR